MPRYHFNIIDGEHLVPDQEGQELADLEAARFEARCSARDLAIQEIKAGVPIDGRKIEITDENGDPLESIMVHDVVLDLGN